MRTQVGIVGAGPAGLLLAHLLELHGIASVVLEVRSRDYVEARVRAGVLEHNTVELLHETGLGERLGREGLRHEGVELRFDGQPHRIDFTELTDGRSITVYGQQEVVKDLIAARVAAGSPPLFEVSDVTVHDLDSDSPSIRFVDADGAAQTLRCDVIAGCDGFHGVCRDSVPAGALTVLERVYPFAWLGILAKAAPSSEELIYSHHPRGFALHSMRSPDVTRNYLQVPPDTDLEAWPDERIWAELRARMELSGGDFTLAEGPLIEKGVTAMRSFVVSPMQYGRLFLAGDSAHIVPPTGAKGLNLAVADVRGAGQGAGAVLRHRQRRGTGPVLRGLPAAGLAGPAFLLVDDVHAAPLPRRRPVHARAAALPAPLRHLLPGGRDHPRRELRRPPVR